MMIFSYIRSTVHYVIALIGIWGHEAPSFFQAPEPVMKETRMSKFQKSLLENGQLLVGIRKVWGWYQEGLGLV